MTFVDPNADPNDPNPQGPPGLREENKRLKKENKELRGAQDELAQLKRERTFVQAGVPLDDKRAAYFIAGYQGDNTPEAIKAEWQATFGGSPQGTGQGQEQNPQVQAELAQLRQIAETTGGPQNLTADRLRERDQKLSALNQNDPRLDEKYNAIIEEYGGRIGSMVG